METDFAFYRVLRHALHALAINEGHLYKAV
jgi:hypothetical protein